MGTRGTRFLRMVLKVKKVDMKSSKFYLIYISISWKYGKILMKINILYRFMNKLHDLVVKFSHFVQICLRKVLRPETHSEEGLNIFRTLLMCITLFHLNYQVHYYVSKNTKKMVYLHLKIWGRNREIQDISTL